MKSFGLLLFVFVFSIHLSCLDDSGETGGKGVLNVTVNVDSKVFEYPMLDGSNYVTFQGDTSYLWLYPSVGGDGLPGGDGEESLSLDPILSTGIGDKNIIVYLYSQLGDHSRAYPVLYRGSTTTNGGVATINKIVAGTYYVVAFYNYCGGDNLENRLNRYDRYSIYTETDPLASTANSTVYYDHASTIEITDNTPVDIVMDIDRDWVLGKPKTNTSTNAGRKFLVYGESIPAP